MLLMGVMNFWMALEHVHHSCYFIYSFTGKVFSGMNMPMSFLSIFLFSKYNFFEYGYNAHLCFTSNLFPVRHPDVFNLCRAAEEFAAFALGSIGPVSCFAVVTPCLFQIGD